MHDLLHEIAISIIAATATGLICHFLKQPIILGYVLAGVLIGKNFGLGLVQDAHTVEVLSEVGLILLLFIIGLEINIGKLLSSGRQLLLTAVCQFPLCVIMGFGFFKIFPLFYTNDALSVLYLCLLLGLSSTAIVVKGLYDKQELDTLPGRLTIGTLVLQDIYAILILAVQPNLANPSLLPIATAIGNTVALLLIGFLFSKYALSALFKSVAKSPEMVLGLALGWCAVMAGIADGLHVSREMGALVAGLAIAAFPYSIHITAKTLPLRDFFLTLFFVSLGMKLTVPDGPILGPVLLLGSFIFLSRFLGIYPLLASTGAGRRAAFVTSLNLSQMSEFALVIGSIGLTLGHIPEDFVSLLVLSMVCMALISSYCIRFSHEIFLLINKVISKTFPEKEIRLNDIHHSDNHDIVFAGFHRGAEAILQVIENKHPALLKRIIVIDFNPVTLSRLKQKGIAVTFGDISSFDTLEHAHIEHARIVLSTVPDTLLKGTNNFILTRMLKRLAPDATIIATAEDRTHQEQLIAEGASVALLPFEISAEWLVPVLNDKLDEAEMFFSEPKTRSANS
ncbi:MAG TPA: cation:proton antiporter [Oligoflexia bacterium]|nr:cation:proton antiporter [Oligoflexia bacterium]HMP48248.1 cation:proton antiporter [Oligoflexia bacterium]